MARVEAARAAMKPELLSNVRALVCVVLLGLSLPASALAFARARRVFRAWDPTSKKLGVAAAFLGATVRALAPKWIVTMFIGYLLTEQAIELSASSHYGMGSLALYHALFAILPRDHRTLMWVNAVVGALTLPLSSTFASRVLRSPRAGVAFALLVALVPLFVKNDDSDANNVPCLFWLFGGLVLLDAYFEEGGALSLFAATALFALAANARPEMPLLLPVLVALSTIGLAPRRARILRPAIGIAIVAFALLVAPHALHVASATERLEDRESLPGFGGRGVARALTLVLRQNTILTPRLFPVALVVLAVLGVVLVPREDRRSMLRARLAIAVSAVLATGIYGLDLCRANMARVHVPGALFVAMLAGAGVDEVWRRTKSAAVRAPIAIAIVATSIPTAFALWAPTNEQAEEEFARSAATALPSDAFVLVRIASVDRDRSSAGATFTHDHFPDYWFRPPEGRGRVSSIRDFIAEPDEEVPAYFYLGVRCYAEFRDDGTPPPHGDAIQPACAEMRERFDLEPVLERSIPNRGDVWLDYYGDAPTLLLGLYRVHPKAHARGDHASRE